MDKPTWFVCENCLWFDGLCRHNSPEVSDEMGGRGTWPWIENDEYCSNWTCRRCWQGWDEYFYPDTASTDDNGMYVNDDTHRFIDHTKCNPVRFANRGDIV